jgi:signal transduction histidine kinase
VVIRASLRDRSDRLRLYAAIALLSSLVAFAAAVLIASQVQRSLAPPILSLTETARKVAAEKDYGVRAAGEGADEIGLLATTFNAMWDTIARRETELREANRLKDQFLATLSHELRTPLNAIVGWAHVLNQGGLDPATARQAVATIERNARAQGKLIEDILDVSRIVSGKLHLNVGPVDVAAVVQAAVDAVGHAAEAKGIRIQTVFDSQAPSPAMPTACSRSSGNCSRTRSSSRPGAGAFTCGCRGRTPTSRSW